MGGEVGGGEGRGVRRGSGRRGGRSGGKGSEEGEWEEGWERGVGREGTYIVGVEGDVVLRLLYNSTRHMWSMPLGTR